MSTLNATVSRREQVRQAIEEAFQAVPYPEDERFAQNPETSEGEEIEEAFKGHHWRNLPEETVSKRMLIFLRPEARHFYMPAFLIAALGRLSQAPTMFDLYSLVPPDDATHFKKEYDTYSSAQRAAIRLFLEYIRDERGRPDCKATAELALERYWGSMPGAMVTKARHEQVKQIIREAFAEVPYPGDNSIAYDPDDWEGRDINLDFSGYSWRGLPHAIVSYHDSALSFLSAAGMQFYLPAYLMAALESDGDILDSVLYALRPSEHHRKTYFESPQASFTPSQRHAIRTFLEYVRDELGDSSGRDEARRSLDAYWANDRSTT